LLQAAPATVNPLKETRLHALHLVQHQAKVGVDGIVGLGAVGVVVGVGLHGS
jgi:hypothetical protein